MKLIWMAQFRDGSILRQFDNEERTKEHSFKEVLDRQDDLSVFNLINTGTGKTYRLNLDTGNVHVLQAGSFVTNAEPDIAVGRKVRLIYFRRMKKDMGFNNAGALVSVGEPAMLASFLGCQWNDPDGKNRKILLQIHEDDQLHIHAE